MRVPTLATRSAKLIGVVMFGVGVASTTMPVKAQAQPLLCMFQLPNCNGTACRDLCDQYYGTSSTASCNPLNGCCNCFL